MSTATCRSVRGRTRSALAAVSLLICPVIAHAKVNVVATLPDYGSLAREVGKDKIDLVVLAEPKEDPHFVAPRPNFVSALQKADVLIDSGAGLEQGWLPPLLQKAHNTRLDAGKPGRVQASEGIRLLGLPANMTAGGNEHPRGNPHFTTDPMIAKAVAQRIAKFLAAADPANAAFYDANYNKFEISINTKLQYWRGALQSLQDEHVAAFHDSWPYFAQRFGLKIDTFLEVTPGTPPTASHMSDVIQKMKREHIKAILVEPYQDQRIIDTLKRSTDVRVVDVAQFPGGIPGTDNYATLMNQLVKRVADALK